MKQRDITIDIIKGIGILCVVVGHSGSPLRHFIYLFHMAIFFIASGYCYKAETAKDLKSVALFIKRKILTLWLPYVLWTGIYSFLHNFFIKINVYTDNPLLMEYVNGSYVSTMAPWTILDMRYNTLRAMIFQSDTQMGGAFWFLATLMEISILYCVIDYVLFKVLNDNKKLNIAQLVVSIVFLAAGFFCYKKNINIAGFNRVLSAYILFYGGFVLKTYGISSKERKKSAHMAILGASFAILLICNFIGTIELGQNSYENPVYLLVTSFAGWQFLYEIAYLIKEMKIPGKILVCMGQNTLAVVIFHFLSFKVVSYIGVILFKQPWCCVAAFPVLYTGGLWWIAYTAVGLLIPILISLFYKKTKNAVIDLNK